MALNRTPLQQRWSTVDASQRSLSGSGFGQRAVIIHYQRYYPSQIVLGWNLCADRFFVSVCVARVCRRVSILPLAYLKNTSRRIRAIQVPIMSLSA